MIISRITSGLGNQLFQYATGRHLALKNKAALYLDLSYYLHEYSDDTVRPFKLDTLRFRTGSSEIAHGVCFQGHPNCCLTGVCPLWFCFLKEKHFHFDQSILDARATCIILEGFWQSEAYFRDDARAIRQELTLSSEPSPEFSHYRQQIGNTPIPVSIHIRRGDYVNHPEFSKTFGFVGLDYYKQALQQLMSTMLRLSCMCSATITRGCTRTWNSRITRFLFRIPP